MINRIKQRYIIVLPIVAAIGFFSCSQGKKEGGSKDSRVVISNAYTDENLNSEILKIIADYLDTINRERHDSLKACRIFIEQKDTQVSYKINSVIHYSAVLEDLPQCYLSFEDKVILIYTGLEKLYKKPVAMPDDLANKLNGKITNDLLPDLKTIDPDFRPGLYSYPTWEVKVEDDSLFVNKNAEPVSRVKTVIYNLPDSIK